MSSYEPIKPHQGLQWHFKADDSGHGPSALYGPPDSEAVIMMGCGDDGINMTMLNVDPSPSRAKAIITSGPSRFDAPTDIGGDPISSADFFVPYELPLLSTMEKLGFTVSFQNGERNPIPGDPIVGKLLNACRAKSAPASGDNFAGEYEGQADGGDGFATITPTARPNQYAVQVGVAGGPSGCGGGTEGIATARGNVLTLLSGNPENSEVCKVTFTRNGNRLLVKEDNCMYTHGHSCAFDGAITRKASSAGRKSAPKARITTAEPLFGDMEGGGPAGDAMVSP